jgi:hypothetical protein
MSLGTFCGAEEHCCGTSKVSTRKELGLEARMRTALLEDTAATQIMQNAHKQTGEFQQYRLIKPNLSLGCVSI